MMIGVTSATGGGGGGVSGVNTLHLNDGVTDQRAEVADSASLDVTNITASVYFLVRQFSGTMTIFSKYQDGVERSWSMDIDPVSRKLSANIYVGSTLFTATQTGILSVDTWYHGAFTYDGSDLKLYVDAALLATNSSPSGSLDTSAADVRIGARGDLTNEQPFIGDIALPIIYSADILQAGIAELLEPKDPSLYTQNMVMGLPLNAGSEAPEVDTSGNSNNAALVGAILPDYTGVKLAIEQNPVVITNNNTLRLDGVNQIIDLGNVGTMGTGDASFSLRMRFTDRTSANMILVKQDNIDSEYRLYSDTSGYLHFDIYINSSNRYDWLYPVNLADGVYRSIQWSTTRSLNKPTVWVDGVDVTSMITNANSAGNVATGTISSAAIVAIGKREISGSELYFPGDVTNVFMLDRDFTPADITELETLKQLEDYSATIKDSYVYALPLNDGVVDPYIDRSANSFDGTPINSPTFTGDQQPFTS